MKKTDLIDIEDIIRGWLEGHDGYDGLCNAELECGCHIGDLMPCLEPDVRECVAGHMAEAPEWSEFDFIVYEGKRPDSN